MSYHRGGQAGAVAVSYSTSPMAPHSPSRRCSSGSGASSASAIATSASKLNTYRSAASSSILDGPTNFYSSPDTSAFLSNYTSEYRRSHCPSGSFYSSTGTSLRRSYLSEYSRSRRSPARSVSSSAYSGTGSSSGSGSGSGSGATNATSRYGLSASSSSSSIISVGGSSRERETLSSSRLDTAADLLRYSPSGYVPNIRQTASSSSSSSSSNSSSCGSHLQLQHQHYHHHQNHHSQWKHRGHGSSSLTEVYGADAGGGGGGGEDQRETVGRDHRPESSLSSSSSSSSAVGGPLWSRSKRRPPLSGGSNSGSTVLGSGHARADSAASPGEVTTDERGTIADPDPDEDEDADDDDNDDGDDDNDNDNDDAEAADADENEDDEDVDVDDRHNNNNNSNSSGAAEDAAAARYLVNNNNDDANDVDDGNLNSRHHPHHRADEVSPAKRNLLSPVLVAGAGGADSLANSLTPNTTSATTVTNPSNGEPLINQALGETHRTWSDSQQQQQQEEEDLDSGDESASSIFNDPIEFLRTCRKREPDAAEEARTRHGSGSSGSGSGSGSGYDIDQTGFVGGSTPPILQNGVAGRPSGTYGDDPFAPSTSRRPDPPFPGTSANNTATSLTTSSSSSSPTPPSTAQQNLYRGLADQFEGSPTNKSARNRLQAHRDERCGLNGLRNIGNTCFMNSVIQCLSNTRPLLEYLLNEQHMADINTSTSSMKGALIKAFSQVIHELWEVGGDHVVNTTALKSQIQRFAPRFMGYSQQDAQEFLRYLLEGLHEDVNRVTVKPQPIHTDIPDMYTDSQKAVESWKRYLRSEDSMIVDVFVGQLRSSLHCTSCNHVSVTLDPFWDLSLPIPARSSTVKLSQCLEHFTREEVLDGDEKPTCSKCQMRRKCTKSFSIQKFPKILVIHLKRFSPMERFRSKLNVMVDFPLTGLDLSAFAAPRVPGCTYNLYGVANHSGTTHSGHYTAYCKHPYSGEWHEYNDSRVSVVSSRSVVSNEAYVLFYEQQPHSSHL